MNQMLKWCILMFLLCVLVSTKINFTIVNQLCFSFGDSKLKINK